MDAPRPDRSKHPLRWFWRLPSAAGLTVFLIARSDPRPLWVELEPSEVALSWSMLGGQSELVREPGWHLVLPRLERFERFGKDSRQLRLEGDSYEGALRQPLLSVRSSDGSEFWFEDLVVQYELDPEALAAAPRAAGEEREQAALGAAARAVLGEEFGRLSVQESVDPERLDAAKRASIERLCKLLAPEGLRVTQILTAKPQFDRQYEKAIADRKLLEQEALRLAQELETADAARPQALAAAEREGERSLGELESDLVRQRLSAETELVRERSAAEVAALQREGEARTKKAQLLAEAGAAQAARAEARRSLEAQVAALAAHGPIHVRQALIAALAKVPLRLEPEPAAPAR
jgi:hypothetical protein